MKRGSLLAENPADCLLSQYQGHIPGTLSLTRSGHATRRDNLCTSKVVKAFGSTMSFMDRDDDNFDDRM